MMQKLVMSYMALSVYRFKTVLKQQIKVYKIWISWCRLYIAWEVSNNEIQYTNKKRNDLINTFSARNYFKYQVIQQLDRWSYRII